MAPRRAAIGKAIGIVMEQCHIHEDEAFARLVRTSQEANIKLHKLAAEIVHDANRTAEFEQIDRSSNT